jgi:hypothetical protein
VVALVEELSFATCVVWSVDVIEKSCKTVVVALCACAAGRFVGSELLDVGTLDPGRMIYNYLYLPFIAVTCTAVVRV